MKELLLKKKEEYEALKAEVLAHDYSPEIEKAVEEYRQHLLANAEIDREQRLAKISSYVEVIDSLIEEVNQPDPEEVAQPESELPLEEQHEDKLNEEV